MLKALENTEKSEQKCSLFCLFGEIQKQSMESAVLSGCAAGGYEDSLLPFFVFFDWFFYNIIDSVAFFLLKLFHKIFANIIKYFF